MPVQIIASKVSDGTLYEFLNEAEDHDKVVNLQKNFPNIYGSLDRVDYNEFIEWVSENEKYCAELFRALLQTVLKDY